MSNGNSKCKAIANGNLCLKSGKSCDCSLCHLHLTLTRQPYI